MYRVVCVCVCVLVLVTLGLQLAQYTVIVEQKEFCREKLINFRGVHSYDVTLL